jgi:4-amino-4-deoxy-L-arabinose transferase-like glycosyltransferase
MTPNHKLQTLFVPAALVFLFLAALAFRPLLPVDETRYMSVAWEMWLRGDWLAPLTLNFELYHHKPPLLFWMINAFWSVFGVNRWAGLIPIFLASMTCLYLTKKLAGKIFKIQDGSFSTVPVLMVGSFPFIIYSTLVMFDLTLTVFVLLALLALLSYADKGKWRYIFAMALALGLGVLTKGPVAWLYVIFPVVFAPLWLPEKRNWWAWYGACALAFVLSLVPVSCWLVPVLKASNPDFAFWLIWEQTAGRITGNMGSAHARPLYFYIPLLPILFLPWAFLPGFWKNIRGIKDDFKTSVGLRFLTFWVVPVIAAFSLIGGKQPHYLLPLLPGIILFIAYQTKEDTGKLIKISAFMVMLAITGQGIAGQTVFKKYDLQPLANYVSAHQDRDWAFVRKYQGELTFLGRLHAGLDSELRTNLPQWFKEHPDGYAVVRYNKPDEISAFHMIMTVPYRGKNMGIFSALPPSESKK